MFEIEIGEYIRTTKGKLLKVENEKTLQIIKFLSVEYGDIVKHSENIIDLIEVGDYVNGHLVLDIVKDENGLEIVTESNLYNNHYRWVEQIKSVVTKEQFEQVQYEVGD